MSSKPVPMTPVDGPCLPQQLAVQPYPPRQPTDQPYPPQQPADQLYPILPQADQPHPSEHNGDQPYPAQQPADQLYPPPDHQQEYRSEQCFGVSPVITQQPSLAYQQTLKTTVVVRRQELAAQSASPRNWSSGLCGCFQDCGSCCLGLWCPYWLLCDVSLRMGEGCCFPNCWPAALTVGLGFGFFGFAAAYPEAIASQLVFTPYLTGYLGAMYKTYIPWAINVVSGCLLVSCSQCCGPSPLAGLRIKLRAQENIKGSLCNDYCLTQCCGPCVLCQLARELNHVEQTRVRRCQPNRIV